jgi:hypothetical protein
MQHGLQIRQAKTYPARHAGEWYVVRTTNHGDKYLFKNLIWYPTAVMPNVRTNAYSKTRHEARLLLNRWNKRQER